MPVEETKGLWGSEKKDKDGAGTYTKKELRTTIVSRSLEVYLCPALFIKRVPVYHQTVESRFSTSSTGSV
jgi:hypothetical protein